MERRDFLKKSSLVLGGLGVSGSIHPAILKAMNIRPEEGSTFYDAEHVVVLMQENRSFDHCFGALKGVRGFKDKYAFRKPNGKSVFFQKDKEGKTYAPFNLDIKNTKATWMSSLPHDWPNQQGALNKGKYNRWLPEKTSNIEKYSKLPLTLGYYNRYDLPFYYQLADAFTVFDQYFCSSLTGTRPNRLYHFSGTLRPEKKGDSYPKLNNQLASELNWKTFPELLEDENISWRCYQNYVTAGSAAVDSNKIPYVGNFGTNAAEYFNQYNTKFFSKYRKYIHKQKIEIEDKLNYNPDDKEGLEKDLKKLKKEIERYNDDRWGRLSSYEKSIHEKALTTNSKDPNYLDLEEIPSVDDEEMFLPKGDILHQFRKDVKNGKLPTISWLSAPKVFCDHPTSPWYGAWYISEVMNILTEDPEVWKKTIFILNYDENDGYFDHVVPFFPPDNPSQKPDFNGAEGAEYVDSSQKYYKEKDLESNEKTEGPIGLGFRVPMVIASPWSTGGYVNSDVSDHTSVIQFLENFLNKKHDKNIHLDNISDWRRAVCSDLTSAFRQNREKNKKLNFLNQKTFVESINLAKNKPIPNNFKALSEDEQRSTSQYFPIQEPGIRPANPLDYRFEVNFIEDAIVMENKASKGVPLNVYNRLKFEEDQDFLFSYALFEKEKREHTIKPDKIYDWEVFGPNGFYRNFVGEDASELQINLRTKQDGNVELNFKGASGGDEVQVENFYSQKKEKISLREKSKLEIDSNEFGGWYDLEVIHKKNTWIFAGRAESGKVSCSDPHWA